MNSDSGRPMELYSQSEMYRQQQQIAAASSMVDFIVTWYGIDMLPGLLYGFGRYEEWETLAPAVLGVGARELEEAWHASRS
jgi:hypothetical protein